MRLKENRWHREDGGGHLVELRSGQNEHQVLRRLLQNLQQSIEGRGGEHVDLVHDVHPLLHIGRGVDGFVPQGPHLVDTVVGGGVQLQYIQKTAVFDAHAGGHWQQGSPSIGCSQLTALAKILAQVVLPVPRVPVKRYAWEVRPSATCLRRVWVMWDWPMTSENVLGRHLRYRA